MNLEQCFYLDGSCIPLDEHGIGNIAGSRVYIPKNNICFAERLPRLPKILRTKYHALFIVQTPIKDQTQHTFIFTHSLNNIYLIGNHIRHPPSQDNRTDKLLLSTLVHQILWTKHNIAHIRITGNEIANQLANEGTARNKPDPAPEHNMHTPYPTSSMESRPVSTKERYANLQIDINESHWEHELIIAKIWSVGRKYGSGQNYIKTLP